jgi:hypothetical protein
MGLKFEKTASNYVDYNSLQYLKDCFDSISKSDYLLEKLETN